MRKVYAVATPAISVDPNRETAISVRQSIISDLLPGSCGALLIPTASPGTDQGVEVQGLPPPEPEYRASECAIRASLSRPEYLASITGRQRSRRLSLRGWPSGVRIATDARDM